MTQVMESIGMVLGLSVFFIASSPVIAVRCLSCFYPKWHPRRDELVAEMFYVLHRERMPRVWLWLGGTVAAVAREALPARIKCLTHRHTVLALGVTAVLAYNGDSVWMIMQWVHQGSWPYGDSLSPPEFFLTTYMGLVMFPYSLRLWWRKGQREPAEVS